MEKFKKGDRVKFDYHFDLGIGTIYECIGTLNGKNLYTVVFDKSNVYLNDGDLGEEYKNKCWNCIENELELVSSKTKVKIVNWRQK